MISTQELSSFVVVLLLLVSSAIALSDCPPRLYSPSVEDRLNEEADRSALIDEPQYPLLRALQKVKCGAYKPRDANASKIESRVAGGYEAQGGEFPSYVQVLSTFRVNPDTLRLSICGGVIISEWLVVTAAHCVTDREHNGTAGDGEFSIRAGSIKRKAGFEISVKSVCLADDSSFEGFDIAILTLEEKLAFNENIQPACFPYADLDYKQQAQAVGLGLTQSTPEKKQPDRLQVLPVKRVEQCPRDRGWLFCFKASSKTYRGDVCSGDSGSGIYVTKGGRQYVTGIVSGGKPQCEPGLSSTSIGVNTFVAYDRMKQMFEECKKSNKPDSII